MLDKKILFSVIEHQASLEAIAIRSNTTEITYGTLLQESNQICNYLLSVGLKKGEVVGVFMSKDWAYVACIMGINMAGGVFMPLEVKYPKERLKHLISYVDPSFIIHGSDQRNTFKELMPHFPTSKILERTTDSVMKHKGVVLQLGDQDYKRPQLTGDDSCYLIYTSGSTGLPKVVEGMHKSLSHFIHWEVKEFELVKESKIGLLAPVSFDVSLRDIFTPLLAGGTLIIPTSEILSDVVGFINWIEESKISLLHTVPSLFRMLISELENKPYSAGFLNTMKHILLAGEPLYGRDVNAFRNLVGNNITLVNLYGPSETTLAKIYYRIPPSNLHDEEIVSLGKPLPNTSISIMNNGRLCGIGDIGEIYIKTPFRSKGYYKNKPLTKEKFIQNPLHTDFEDILYKTGDLGKYNSEKNIDFVGRLDSQVKIRGNRVELGEVEKVVSSFTGVKQCVISALTGVEKEIKLACYYTEAFSLELNSLKQHLSSFLPDYMHPNYFVLIEDFPLNLNGKINKKGLPQPEELLYEQLVYIAPSNKTEALISEIWSSVLGINKVGVTNSFFELGGHSLAATKIVSKIVEKLGKSISLRAFFENPTVRGIAGVLEETMTSSMRPIEKVKEGKSNYDISFGQKRMLILSEKSENKSLYNMPLAYTFKGNFSISAFQTAFSLLIERHESLRTTFKEVQGVLKQVIHKKTDFKIEIEDASGSFNNIIEHEIAKLLKISFDLAKGPLIYGRLIKLEEDRHLFLFTIHHSITDGWSFGILFREIQLLYKEVSKKLERSLPPLEYQYKDYSQWSYDQNKDGYFASQKKYWHTKIGDISQLKKIPTEFSNQNKTPMGAKHTLVISEKISKEVRLFCKNKKVSLFTFLLANIYLQLSKWSGLDMISMGTTVSGRRRGEFEKVIGMFMNNLVLKTELFPDEYFSSFLNRVNHLTTEAYENQEYPFDLLVDDFTSSLLKSDNPFYNVLVVMNNKGLMGDKAMTSWLGDEVKIQSVKIIEESSKVDLSFLCYDDKEIAVTFEYNQHLFQESTIQNMSTTLLQLMNTTTGKDLIIDDLKKSISNQDQIDLKKSIQQNNTAPLEESF